MASYEYSCSKCDIKIIKHRGISESDPGYSCETCNSELTRVYSSSISVTFNGSGFYSTDK
jgi:putative FmdB family regulatory protein